MVVEDFYCDPTVVLNHDMLAGFALVLAHIVHARPHPCRGMVSWSEQFMP